MTSSIEQMKNEAWGGDSIKYNTKGIV
jgi:hypothetical protein